jgi:hypothetical protein
MSTSTIQSNSYETEIAQIVQFLKKTERKREKNIYKTLTYTELPRWEELCVNGIAPLKVHQQTCNVFTAAFDTVMHATMVRLVK